MCGRVTLTREDIAEIAADLDADISRDDVDRYRPRYNVAPSDLHWILEHDADRRVLVPAVWGYLASGRPLINVRGEQVGSGAGFREAFRSRRCVVVTDGFFEWSATKAPFWYHRSDGGLVLLGGLYQSQGAASSRAAPSPAASSGRDARDAHPRFTILTTRPNRLVSAVHNRMPVVLSRDQVGDWLTAEPARAAKLIVSAPEDALVATPVSKRVNSVKNDDAACLSPDDGSIDAPANTRQKSLF
jgi:putative SOS response-associated peptidase YedK